MNRFSFFFILSLAILKVVAPVMVAQAQLVPPETLKETSVRFQGKKEKFYCLGKTAGTGKRRNDMILFTPFSTTIKKLAPRKFQRQKERLIALNKVASKACKALLTSPSPTPTPTPPASPTNPPAPTPTFASGNFDAQGNVTAQGKITFGIPSNLSANISIGKNINQQSCAGCHGEKTGRSFSQYRQLIALSPMYITSGDVPDADLANLTAYLNRFRL